MSYIKVGNSQKILNDWKYFQWVIRDLRNGTIDREGFSRDWEKLQPERRVEKKFSVPYMVGKNRERRALNVNFSTM